MVSEIPFQAGELPGESLCKARHLSRLQRAVERHHFWLLAEFHLVTNPEHTLSRALSALLERPSWQCLNFPKLRELCIAQSGGRQGNYIVKLFWRFIGQTYLFFLSMEFFVLCKTVHRLAVFCLLPFSIGLFGLQCGDVALTHCQNLKLGGCLLLQQFMAR